MERRVCVVSALTWLLFYNGEQFPFYHDFGAECYNTASKMGIRFYNVVIMPPWSSVVQSSVFDQKVLGSIPTGGRHK